MNDGRKARDLELLDAIDKLQRTVFNGQVWRVVRETRDVLQASRVGARWDPGTFDVLYTSVDRDGALEEVYFHLSRQPIFPSVPFQIHRIRVNVKNILRLDQMSQLEQLGVDVANYSNMDYSRTQAIADAAFFLGFECLLVPSARANFLNLVLFADHVEIAGTEVDLTEAVDWKAWRRSR
jgi:RES domain-containing protein